MRVRPNKYACYALLARVNLYAGYWEEAANEAAVVLNKTSLYVFEQDLDKVFLKESTATIWQLSPAFDSGNTLESETFNFSVSNRVINAFNPVPKPISKIEIELAQQDLHQLFSPSLFEKVLQKKLLLQ